MIQITKRPKNHVCVHNNITIEQAVKDYAQSIGISAESVSTLLDGYDGDMLIARVVEKISEAPFRGKAFDDGGPVIDPARITKGVPRIKNA